MRLLTKTLPPLLIALLAASSLIMVQSVFAQSTTKPSVPEFTVSVTDHSYDIQTTTNTTTDPYDGHISTETTPGYHMVNGSVEISIKNQPFTSYYASNGYPIKLYYDIRAKGIDASFWYYIPGVVEEDYFESSTSSYTTFTILYAGHGLHAGTGDLDIKTDGTIDFQVKAFIGYKNVTRLPSASLVPRSEDFITQYVGQSSDWSNTQTATIPNGAYTPITPPPLPTAKPTAPNPTSNPTFPSLTWAPTTNSTSNISFNYSIYLNPDAFVVIIAVLIGVIVVLVVMLVYMKHKGAANHQ